jgi:hypothetical protein
MPRVTIKGSGSHPGDDPGDAAGLLEQFLERAGYTKDLLWEARIEKTGQAPWDSPPVRIIGFKHWVIYVRVKPTIDADVDLYMSLLIPDSSGYAAEDVYRQLKANVKSFNRFVRTQESREKATEPGMKKLMRCRRSSPASRPRTIPPRGHPPRSSPRPKRAPPLLCRPPLPRLRHPFRRRCTGTWSSRRSRA